jgi:multidrug resistance efflux pump
MAMVAKTKKSTRRRKTAASRREALIKVLVTAEERERFQAAADQTGMSLSTWLRWVALEATRRGPAPEST